MRGVAVAASAGTQRAPWRLRMLIVGGVALFAGCSLSDVRTSSDQSSTTFEVTSQNLTAAPGESVILQLRATCPSDEPIDLVARVTGVDSAQWQVTGRRTLTDPPAPATLSRIFWSCDRPGNSASSFHTGFYELTFTARAAATPATYPLVLTLAEGRDFDTPGYAKADFPRELQVTPSRFGTNLLVNPGFESAVLAGSLPTAPGNWQGDRADSVGADQGITPRLPGAQMLKFIASGDVPSTNNLTSQQWQIVDVSAYRADIDATRVRADASAWFNRVVGNAGVTDRRFDLRLHAFSGTPSQLPVSYANPAGVRLAELTVSVDTTGNAWQQAVLQLALPAGTTYLLVEIYAYEDVRNDAVLPEFDGHYADDISLMLIRN